MNLSEGCMLKTSALVFVKSVEVLSMLARGMNLFHC